MTDFDHTLAPHEIRRIAADAFVFGFPLVLVDLVRRAHPVGANQVLHLPDDAADVAPGLRDGDPRMVQSSAWIDLSSGPMVITMPPVEGRHLTLTLIDAWGETVPAPRANPAEGVGLVLAGPRGLTDPKLGLTVLRARTDAVWMVTRLAADSIADREAARDLLAAQRIRPYEEPSYGSAFPPPVLEPPAKASIEAIGNLPPEIFLHRLAVLLARHPHARVAADLEALALINVAPGKPYAPPPHDSKEYQATIRGLADGLAKIKHAANPAPPAIGWRRLYSSPSPNDHLAYAAAALSGLGAAAAESILHFACEVDDTGRPFNGAERYECRFAPGDTPPVGAFWSLSLQRRPAHGELLLHRYALSDRDRPQPEPNGELSLWIQHTPPSSGLAANWLPAPLGEFALVLRLHAPKDAALTGAWRPPPVRRLEPSAK